MYYVDHKQIEDRLRCISYIVEASERLCQTWDASDPLYVLAQERTLHLAIEVITDVGSLLIDGFLMRDASSYEDIINVLIGEKVFTADLEIPMIQLVKLRKPLVQDYMHLDRFHLHPITKLLPSLLSTWEASVFLFLKQEL
ncbi:MAG: HepT-like ribonuclease domain-containing protein [Paenibacillaceae bacterium]